MRSNQLQKCGLPSAADWATCAPKVYAMYDAKLLENTLQLREWHQVRDGHALRRGHWSRVC